MDHIERLTALARQIAQEAGPYLVVNSVMYFKPLNGYKFTFDINNEDDFHFFDLMPAKACELGRTKNSFARH